MKILLIAYYYPPVHTGGTDRPHRMARYLPLLGHTVSVLTHSGDPRPIDEKSVIRIFDPSFNKHRGTLFRKAVWVMRRVYTEALNIAGIYHSIYSPWRNRVLKRRSEIMGDVRPDIIIATYPPVETLEAGLEFSIKHHVPLVADFRDGLMFEPNESKRMERYACIHKHYARLERDVCRHAALIVTVNDPIADYYRKSYPGSLVEVISNGFDPSDFKNLQPHPLDSGCFHIVHTGRFSLSHAPINPGVFFNPLRRLIARYPHMEKRLKVHLMGELVSTELEPLRDLIQSGVVEYYGMVPRSRCLELQQSADLLLIITHAERISAQTAKIFEYIYSQRPILALTHPDSVLADVISRTHTGWAIHPGDSNAIETFLKKILDAPALTDMPPFHPDKNEIGKYSFYEQLQRLARLLAPLTSEQGNSTDFGTSALDK